MADLSSLLAGAGFVATAVLAFFGTVAVVVSLHELGHLLAAKAAGVYCPIFAIGFGRPLVRVRWGETEYRIGWIPLGGFVRIASRDESSAVAAMEGGKLAVSEGGGGAAGGGDDELVPFGTRPIPADRLLEAKPVLTRLVIMSAGVAMNLLLGWVVLAGIASYYGRPVTPTRVIGGVRPGMGEATAALRARVSVGDTILAVDGRRVGTWNDVVRQVRGGTGELQLTTSRGAVRVPVQHFRDRAILADAMEPYFSPVVRRVLPGTAAARGGVAVGDSIVRVDGLPVRTWPEVLRWVEGAAGRELRLEVTRGGETVTLRVRPDSGRRDEGPDGGPRVVGKLGVTMAPIMAREPISAGEALAAGLRGTTRICGMVVGALGRMVSGSMPVREISGPIAIAQHTGGAASRGLVQLFGVMAFLSINVALFNLLVPIPVLDGGQIVLTLLEGIRGRPLSSVTRERLMRAGLVMVIALFALVMVNDIGKLFE